MREVDHVLVKHGIWVAQYERRQSFVAHSWVFVIDCFACRGEKHGVYLGPARLIWLDPPMLSLKCFLQNHAHLLCLTEYRSEAAVAIKALSRTAEAAKWFLRLLCYFKHLFSNLSELLDKLSICFCVEDLRQVSITDGSFRISDICFCLLHVPLDPDGVLFLYKVLIDVSIVSRAVIDGLYLNSLEESQGPVHQASCISQSFCRSPRSFP